MARGLSINIGVNNVNPSVYGSPLSLRGCENDARSMQAIAKAAGFDTPASNLLLSSAATAQNVSDAIRAGAAELQQSDILFLTYSGHGGQVPDPSGEEEDAKNETWVLYDRQLIDDELNLLFGQFASGVRIFVLSDSCHSGTVIKDIVTGALYDATREATLNALPMLTRDLVGLNSVLPTTKELPFLVQADVYLKNKELYDSLPRAKDVRPAASIILISGCQDNQVSLDGSQNGLFTEKLLLVWNNGAFTGNYESFHGAIGRLLPNTQSPRFYIAGTPLPEFQRQQPLTIPPPVGILSAAPSDGGRPNWVTLALQNFRKEINMTSSSAGANGGQEKWLEFIPIAVNLGMQVVDALSKGGFELQDQTGTKVVATKDAASEKWLEFIPLAIDLGIQVYDALSKGGALPAEKQVPLPKDFSPESTKGWLDLIPIAIDLGTEVFNSLTKEGYVASSANLPEIPKLDDPAAKGWLDLVPIALDIGSQVFDALTKSSGTTSSFTKSIGPVTETAMYSGGTKAAPTKEAVPSFSGEVLKAVRGK